MRSLSYENEFYSQVHSNANHTHFHMKDFALGLGLKQRQKATRKWPIVGVPGAMHLLQIQLSTIAIVCLIVSILFK